MVMASNLIAMASNLEAMAMGFVMVYHGLSNLSRNTGNTCYISEVILPTKVSKAHLA